MTEQQYRIEARSKRGEQFLILTDSRSRALHFAGVFRASPEEYPQVSVEVGGRIWIGARIGEIP